MNEIKIVIDGKELTTREVAESRELRSKFFEEYSAAAREVYEQEKSNDEDDCENKSCCDCDVDCDVKWIHCVSEYKNFTDLKYHVCVHVFDEDEIDSYHTAIETADLYNSWNNMYKEIHYLFYDYIEDCDTSEITITEGECGCTIFAESADGYRAVFWLKPDGEEGKDWFYDNEENENNES